MLPQGASSCECKALLLEGEDQRQKKAAKGKGALSSKSPEVKINGAGTLKPKAAFSPFFLSLVDSLCFRSLDEIKDSFHRISNSPFSKGLTQKGKSMTSLRIETGGGMLVSCFEFK